MPFADTAELADILGEPPATIYRALTGLLADGIVVHVSHGGTHLPSSWKCHPTAKGVGGAAGIIGLDSPAFVVWVHRFEFADTLYDCAQPPRQYTQLGFIPTPVSPTHKVIAPARWHKQATIQRIGP